MNKKILELAEFYGIKVNDKQGCRIIENGVARPATREELQSILGF